MKGHPHVDSGSLLDAFLRFVRRIGFWASTHVERRENTRRLAAAWAVGTRVQFTGACCVAARRAGSRVYVVREYFVEADDYRLSPEGSKDYSDGTTYGCANGLRLAP